MIYLNSVFLVLSTLVGLYFWTTNRPVALFNLFAAGINLAAVIGHFT